MKKLEEDFNEEINIYTHFYLSYFFMITVDKEKYMI